MKIEKCQKDFKSFDSRKANISKLGNELVYNKAVIDKDKEDLEKKSGMIKEATEKLEKEALGMDISSNDIDNAKILFNLKK
jgi:hypothetical protein